MRPIDPSETLTALPWGSENWAKRTLPWPRAAYSKWRLVNRARLLLVKDLSRRVRSLQLALQKVGNLGLPKRFSKIFHRRDPFPPSVSSLVRP
jgi:hypothetical protein